MKAMTEHIGSSKYASPVLQISDLEGVTGRGNQKDWHIQDTYENQQEWHK